MGHLVMQGTLKAAPRLRSLAVLIIYCQPLTQSEQQQWHVIRSAALGSWGTSRRSATASVVDRNTGAVAARLPRFIYLCNDYRPLAHHSSRCREGSVPLLVAFACSRFFQVTLTAWVVSVLHCITSFSVKCSALPYVFNRRLVYSCLACFAHCCLFMVTYMDL